MGPRLGDSCVCWLLLLLFTFVFLSSLQAVETNLASKDSHWVFVNEVRARDVEGHGLPRAPCPWGVPRGMP